MIYNLPSKFLFLLPFFFQGDSGGPLVCLKNSRLVLAGISSFSNELCKIHGFPAVYTAVSEFVNWIYHILKTN